MYRAKIELISGSMVFASGKWLYCIGNKNFHVGDFVWTDGQCVFGNFQEAQQPQVIIAPDDEGIPILIYDNFRNETDVHFYTYKANRRLKNVATTKSSKHFFLWNDTKKNLYTHSYTAAIIDTSTAGSEDFMADTQYTIAANIDKKGNIYEIRSSKEYYYILQPPDKYTFFFYLNDQITTSVYILKNGEVVSKIKLGTDYWKTVTFLEEPTSYIHSSITNPFWGVIEDENNWAFMFYEVGDNYFNEPYRAFIYTPTGKKEIFCTEYQMYDVTSFTSQEITDKIPIQDNYYFKINGVSDVPSLPSGQRKFIPAFMNISIYSPNDTLLLTDDFVFGSYLTIYNGKILGVNDENRSHMFENNKIDGSKSGLYLIKNGKLELLIKGFVRNWKLRPMKKKYRKWYKHIQALDLKSAKKELETYNIITKETSTGALFEEQEGIISDLNDT